jgi:hypothetical protein
MSRVTATSMATGTPPIEMAKVTAGRKDSSTPMSRSLLVDVKTVCVRVELKLRMLEHVRTISWWW